jgi:hypothetical protein
MYIVRACICCVYIYLYIYRMHRLTSCDDVGSVWETVTPQSKRRLRLQRRRVSHSNIQTFKHSNISTFKHCSNIQTFKHSESLISSFPCMCPVCVLLALSCGMYVLTFSFASYLCGSCVVLSVMYMSSHSLFCVPSVWLLYCMWWCQEEATPPKGAETGQLRTDAWYVIFFYIYVYI